VNATRPRALPRHPDLAQLRRQSKELQRAFAAGDDTATALVSAHYRHADSTTFRLHDAQFVLARSYGFESWPKLKAYVDRITIGRLADAIRSGNLVEVRAMVAARPALARLQLAPVDERTALHLSVLARSPEMTRELMRRGADPHRGVYPHRDATSALTLATDRGYDDVVAVMLSEYRPSRSASRPAAAAGGQLSAAVQNRQPEVLATLLDHGLDPNEPERVDGLDEEVFSWGAPLYHCAGAGEYAMAELLLQRGADPNARVFASGSPVFQAYGVPDDKMIALLARFGGVPDAVTAGLFGETELAANILRGDVEARLQEATFAGRTVAEQLLWGAACGGAPDIVRAALSDVDWPGDDARWYAILEQPLRMWTHRTHAPERSAYLECFRLVLCRSGANVRGRFGTTILHDVAASRERVTAEERLAFATMLLDAGANIRVRDDLLRSTALGWACRWGRAELVKLLLDRGADPMEPDADPWATPRAWATKMHRNDVLNVIAREPTRGLDQLYMSR
jgi:ankyrin repeat protein